MKETGVLKTFRVELGPNAYNHKIPIWDGDARTGWKFPDHNSFAAFNKLIMDDMSFDAVVVTRIPMGHVIFDVGSQSYRPQVETITPDVSDQRQIAWARGSTATGDMYTGLSDPDKTMFSDIYLSRGDSEVLPYKMPINCVLILEQVLLTELESIEISAKNKQLGMEPRLGLFTKPQR